jgi:hypothetical protein
VTPFALLVLFLFIGIPVLVTMFVKRGGSLRGAVTRPRRITSTDRALGSPSSTPRWLRTLVISAVVWATVTGLATLVSSTLAIWAGGVVIAGGAVAVYRAIQMPYKFDDDAFDKALRDLLDRSDS